MNCFIFKMGDAGKVPLDLQLATSVPLGIRAYRRRFVSPCTNLQDAGPDDYVNIYPDTSTPGSFIDPESTYLTFDFQITNTHYCVDFTDFGVEGVGGAIIQDWRVYNQGSILEEILEYGTVASAMANIEGSYEHEVSFYFSSKLKNGYQEAFHRNFIKPPMVDSVGNIMHGPNPFGLSVAATMIDSGTSLYANEGLIAVQGVSQLLVQSGISSVGQIVAASGVAATPVVTAIGFFSATGESTGQVTSQPPFINTLTLVGVPTWASTATIIATCRITAADFPDQFSPTFVDIVRNYTAEFGTINKPQVMANLCNVKCYPIGKKSAMTSFSGTPAAFGVTGSNPAAVTSVDPAANVSIYRICYRPYSGIFGKMATKMLATTLLSPQQMYINLHLASTQIALNVSADPCRRISGTIRDFIRNIGTGNGKAYGSTTYTLLANSGNIYDYATSDYTQGYGPFHCIPLNDGILYVNGSISTIFSSAAACGHSLVYGTGGAIDAQTNVSLANSLSSTGLTTFWGVSTKPQNVPPSPQYVLSTTPWLFNPLKDVSGAPVVKYAGETEVFYGTYLKHSVPQSARIFDNNFSGTTNTGGRTRTGTMPNGAITYKLTNINLVGDQLILPNEVTADIIQQAEAGNFNVHTNSVRTYNLQIQNATSQSIICPLKVNMAKRILFVFQNNIVRNSTTAITYDSNCGLNPFASLASAADSVPISMAGFDSTVTNGTSVAKTIYGCGYDKTLIYSPTLTTSGGNSMQLQLRIGNDFYPPQPLTSMQEIAVELTKTLEGWSSSTFSPVVDGEVINGDKYNCLQPSKFVTTFVSNDLLDDQTITSNPDFVPLYCNVVGVAANAAASTQAVAVGSRTSSLNGYNYLSPRGFCVPGMFKSPSSRFILGFNMRSFKSSDGVDGGTYLGNNTITLIMNGTVGLNVAGQSYRAVAIVPYRAAMRYSPGGQIVWAY